MNLEQIKKRLDVPEDAGDEWIHARADKVPGALVEAHKEAKKAEGRAAETIAPPDSEPLWRLYAASAELALDAAAQAHDRISSGLSLEDVQALAPQLYVVALAKWLEGGRKERYRKAIWYKCFDETRRWIYAKRQTQTAGSEALTRVVRAHIDEFDEQDPEEVAAKLQDRFRDAADNKLETVANRVREVRLERTLKSLDAPAETGSNDRGGGAEATLGDLIAANTADRPLDLRLIGQNLAALLGKEELWERLSTPTRTAAWGKEELSRLGEEKDVQIADKLNRGLAEVRNLRRALGIPAKDAKQHGQRALSDQQVEEIRRRHANENISQRALAGDYPASRTVIRKVINHEGAYE